MESAYRDPLYEFMPEREARTATLIGSTQLKKQITIEPNSPMLPEILFLSSYPPRECGIATYSQDLVTAMINKFGDSFDIRVCALETGDMGYDYPEKVAYKLDVTDFESYQNLAKIINTSATIQTVMIQHEFGLFESGNEGDFLKFLLLVNKPIVLVFHTVLPRPNALRKMEVKNMVEACESVIVMTKDAANILKNDYNIQEKKIKVVAHGTHLVTHVNKEILKEKYGFKDKKVFSTFGLLSSGKGIETTLEALPAIIKTHPDVLFLIIGKTHPSVIKSEGEKYRNELEARVRELNIDLHVKFINSYLSLPDLLEYLQLTDIYFFTSKDPNQAVSGTFAYAMSCACPIVSTPIPHAVEVLSGDTGIIVDFQNSQQLTEAALRLLNDEELRTTISSNALQKSIATSWENSAVAHATLLEKILGDRMHLTYHLPPINLIHFRQLTTSFGMIQFSKINQPDLESGFTLDDNVRAMIAICMHYELTADEEDLNYIRTYLDFIAYCVTADGYLLNYVNANQEFTPQNKIANLADSNGRAIWSLGYVISMQDKLPKEFTDKAESIMNQVVPRIEMMYSTRAMAFSIKGLYYCYNKTASPTHYSLIKMLADRLVAMYKHEAENGWEWFECYLTYGNSVLPEAMLQAWLVTNDPTYKEIAKISFDFLLKNTFNDKGIQVVSNKSWMQKGQISDRFGEQPIDVTYTILALAQFYEAFQNKHYCDKMETAFNWFLGKNHLGQIIYNPCTGGCFDGLEETQVNINQGAESTVCYLMARLTIEKYKNEIEKVRPLTWLVLE